jgi:sulfate permease, SulP family
MPRRSAGARSNRGPVPLIGVLRSYDRSWLRGDVIAGVTVAALIIPKNLGYAGIAGIPLQNGLYAAAAGAILYAVFGTCRQISMGPSSGLAAVAASAVFAAGLSDQNEIAVFVAGITLVSGLLFLVLALARMSWIAQFLSQAVVTGFLFGAAIDVVIGELPKLTGTEASGSSSLRELWSWLRRCRPRTDLPWSSDLPHLPSSSVCGSSPLGLPGPWCWSWVACWPAGSSSSLTMAWRW